MRLLEKDPARRPASAAEVLAALESVAPAPAGREPVEGQEAATSTDQHPMYRRVFVGREGELRQLETAFDGALSGQGSLLMVVGEPGIGKTSVCEQLATYAAMRGGKALVGHCYEEGSLSLPYLAFVEAMRSYSWRESLMASKRTWAAVPRRWPVSSRRSVSGCRWSFLPPGTRRRSATGCSRR